MLEAQHYKVSNFLTGTVSICWGKNLNKKIYHYINLSAKPLICHSVLCRYNLGITEIMFAITFGDVLSSFYQAFSVQSVAFKIM
jgi:hypothetical protein